MFIRFRKSRSDGREPLAVSAKLIHARDWQHGARRPRARWRIGYEEGLKLIPYRLHVTIADNRRIGGKVKQEHVADLGSIDGVLLPAFWQGLDEGLLSETRKPEWERLSIRARVDFWERVKRRLDRLANRLGPDDVKRVRLAIHARVPWPKQPEREKLVLLEAEADYQSACRGYEGHTRLVALHEKGIAHHNEMIADLKNIAFYEIREVTAAADAVKRLKEKK